MAWILDHDIRGMDGLIAGSDEMANTITCAEHKNLILIMLNHYYNYFDHDSEEE